MKDVRALAPYCLSVSRRPLGLWICNGQGDGRTQGTVITWHLALWTSALVRLLANTADIIIVIVVLVWLGMAMYLVRIG